MTVITGNRQLAADARALADVAAPGSAEGKAAGCAAVALATTRTLSAACAVLTAGRLDPAVRQAALAVLGQLSRENT